MQTEEMIGAAVRPEGVKVKSFVVAVVGNPNCGKTTLFNALTGLNQRVGNWPGVTVDKKTGSFIRDGVRFMLVDLPGIYSLSALSQDEEIARDYILSCEADLVVNIVDASNPDRNLYLTSRLLEMQVPVVVALNMIDVAAEKGIETDVAELARRLGTPVVSLVASRGDGVDELQSAIATGVVEKRVAGGRVTYPGPLDRAISEMSGEVSAAAGAMQYDPAWLALKLLEGDDYLEARLDPAVRELVVHRREAVAGQLGDDADIVIADTHYRFVGDLSGSAVKRKTDKVVTFSDRIDHVVLNRFLGIPVFLLVMYLMFLFTINVGGAFIDFFDIAAGALFVDGFGLLLSSLGSPEWLVTILAGGLGGALQTMATFIPPIGFMFIFLSILEDSGYMARAAYVMDRGMRAIGLPGKAFIPMLVGFGCSVPAIMSARTMNDERDRLMTIMMVPFMSCGARLPVYALFAAAFFPVGGQNLVFLLYLMGIAVAVLTGFILKNTLLRGEVSSFIMEMPAYHLPTLQGIAIRVWERLKSFLFKAGKVLVPVIMVLSFMNSLGTDGSFGNEDTEHSVLSATGKAITPVFQPFGVSQDNWPAAVGLFTGIFAKEAVVGTLDNLYGQMSASDESQAEREESFSLFGAMSEAVATIPENLAGITETLLDPLGISIGDVSDTTVVAEEQEVSTSIFGSMVSLFDGTAGAFAYLVFILLYFPCSAAIAAVYRETNLGWTLFAGAWTTGLAYFFAVITYQAATFAAHPVSSVFWIGAMMLTGGVAVGLMYIKGQGFTFGKSRS
jgi:ferrous iron transport protein B